MEIYITDKKTTRRIELKAFKDGNLSPDFFPDVADTLPKDFPICETDRREQPDAAAAMTDAEFEETVSWWQAEVDKYNAHDARSWFAESCDDPETEFARGVVYELFVR